MTANHGGLYDAVIIGGGLGGLVAGAKLAKEGRRVLLIEQDRVVGGCATGSRRDAIMIMDSATRKGWNRWIED